MAARPKTDGLAASDAFQLAKFYNVAKGESSIGVSVSPADKLGVKHCAVVKIDVGQSAAVAILVMARSVGIVEKQANGFAFDQATGEFFGVPAETLHSLIRMNGFRRIDTDESHFFVRTNDDCVAVDHTDDQALFGTFVVRFSGLLGNANARRLAECRIGFQRRRCE